MGSRLEICCGLHAVAHRRSARRGLLRPFHDANGPTTSPFSSRRTPDSLSWTYSRRCSCSTSFAVLGRRAARSAFHCAIDARYSSFPLRVAALRRSSRDIVDGDLPIRIAICRMLIPSARRTAMSSRSEKDRYLPDTGASSIGGIPPACRNHRDPTGPDTPHATAASSLVSPRAICTQNARSRSRRTGGRPGDSITARPVNAAAQPGGRPIESTSIVEVLRPPVEPGQYTSIRFGERLAQAGIQPSVGAVGSSYDNALAETINGLYKTELIKPRKPWRTIEDVEVATAEWVHWFGYAGDLRRVS